MSKLSSTKITRGIAEHFRNIHREYENDFPDVTDFLRRHLFFITLTCKPASVSARDDGPLHPLRLFGRLYSNISKTLVPSHYARKRSYQPLTYAAVDFAGSRDGNSAAVEAMEMLHVHALMLVRPEHLATFLQNERNI